MTTKEKIQDILVTVSGPDQPGITAKLTKILARDHIEILDIGQTVTHGLLSLSILVAVKESSLDSPFLRDMLFEAKTLNLSLDFKVISRKEILEHTQERFIINCVSQDSIAAAFLSDLAEELSKNQINIHRLEKFSPGSFNSLEVTTLSSKEIDWSQVKRNIISLANPHHVDIAVVRDNVFRTNKRLIIFDMDSTLIQQEVIDELAKHAGVESEVKAITEKAMDGQLDFSASLKERVKLLKGVQESALHEVLESLSFTPGVEGFVKTVKALGFKVAVISGGFDYFANSLKQKLGLDYAFANQLEIKQGTLTGEVVGTIVDANHKATLMDMLAQQESISLEQVVAIGDGANDLPMLTKAGLGIAFKAKPFVRDQTDNQMGHGPMTTVLHFLGIPEDHFLG